MAGINKLICMFLILAVFLVDDAPRGEAAVGCGAVVSFLNPCIPYITDNGPIGGCCGGVQRVYSEAKSTADRQSVCNCLKTVSGSFPNLNLGKVAGLPAQCGVKLSYRISPSIDCSKVV